MVNSETKTFKLQKCRNQYTLNLSRVLIESLNWSKGKKIIEKINDNNNLELIGVDKHD